jgi:hypothetical protein
VTHLEGSIVPQRPLCARRQAKLRGELSEAASYPRELIGDCVRPAQIVDRLGLHGMQIDEAHPEGAVRVEQRGEVWLVEPRGMLSDFPHDSADTLVALPDGARWGPLLSRRYFCRVAHDFAGGAPFCCRRASRRARLASTLALRRASLIFRSMFTLQQ